MRKLAAGGADLPDFRACFFRLLAPPLGLMIYP
jgi:hypothetical protein